MDFFSLSVEEFALSFSLVGRPDIGKLTLQETFVDLDSNQVQERLTAAAHSLLARELAYIQEDSLILKRTLYDALSIISDKSEFVISMIVVTPTENIRSMNLHYSNVGFATHWVQWGVVHHLVYSESIDQAKDVLVSFLPNSMFCRDKPDINKDNTFITGIEFAHMIEALFTSKVDDNSIQLETEAQDVLHLVLEDLKKSTWRGVITYIEKQDLDIPLVFSSASQEDATIPQNLPALIFFKGTRSWLLAFPANETSPGWLSTLTRGGLEKYVDDLVKRGYDAFM